MEILVVSIIIIGLIAMAIIWDKREQLKEEREKQEEQLRLKQKKLQEDAERFERLKERILSGEISPISPPTPHLMLQLDERTYYATTAVLMKQRSGYTSLEDVGNLIVTNKRLIFIGLSKTINYKLTKILALAPLEASICIVIEGRQNPLVFIVDYPREAAGYISFLRVLALHRIELPIFSAALRASFLQEMQAQVRETGQESTE